MVNLLHGPGGGGGGNFLRKGGEGWEKVLFYAMNFIW